MLRIIAPGESPDLVEELRRLRTAVFLEDRVPVGDDTAFDAASWHLVVGNPITGCLRFFVHAAPPVTVRDLHIWSPVWTNTMKTALYEEIDLVRRRPGTHFAETGGWAVAPSRRGSTDSLRLIRAAYALSRRLGGGVAITAANRRYGASAVMQRLGGRAISTPYFDPQFNGEVELVRFDTLGGSTC